MSILCPAGQEHTRFLSDTKGFCRLSNCCSDSYARNTQGREGFPQGLWNCGLFVCLWPPREKNCTSSVEWGRPTGQPTTQLDK